jgi:hypothetical protein
MTDKLRFSTRLSAWLTETLSQSINIFIELDARFSNSYAKEF